MNRRELMQRGTAVIAGAIASRATGSAAQSRLPEIDPICFRVHPISVELAPRVVVPALGCNGSLNGPLMRLHSADRLQISIVNDANCDIDITASGLPHDLRVAAGAHAIAEFDSLSSGILCPSISSLGSRNEVLSGMAGIFLLRKPSHAVDQAHYLPIHHWLPSPAMGAGALLGTGITYRHASLGDRLLHASEPIRVREGERVLFHFVNASPTKCVTLKLPRHQFLVSALDGYPVPRPREVDHLAIGPGERVEAMVQMTSPGRFVLGSIDRRDRDAGFGRVVEYANAHGPALHPTIEPSVWNYGSFGRERISTTTDVGLVPITVKLGNRAEESRDDSHRLKLDAGRRYRLSIINTTGERPRIALRGHHFALTRVAGIAMEGIVKDTIALPSFARTELEFVAAKPVVELLHAKTSVTETL